MVKKSENPKEWYNEIVRKANIIDDAYPVKGMPVYKPYGYKAFKFLMSLLENKLESIGAEPAWFPIVIPYSIFKKESEHIKGFEEEVFWIERAGNDKLEDPLILRPTSETEMYYMFAKWIESYRDLPLIIYMTNTVYRYETKSTKALIRGREVLWNETHSVHRSEEDAREHMAKAKEVYDYIFWDVLYLPYIWVRRPEWDKFPGGEETYAADAIMPDGRFLQVGTIHLLGQKFAIPFEIKFLDYHPFYKKYGDPNIYIKDKNGNEYKVHAPKEFWEELEKGKLTKTYTIKIGDKEYTISSIEEINEKLKEYDFRKYVWQTSYGISMRAFGGALYWLGDDLGLVMPYKIAPIQIVIIPILGKDDTKVIEYSKKVYELIKDKYRVYLDSDDTKTPGYKYYYYDLIGVPLRIDIGLKEVENNSITIVRRDNKKKYTISLNELEKIDQIFKEMEEDLKQKAKSFVNDMVVRVKTFDELKEAIEQNKIAKAPFCMRESCANQIKELLHAEVRGTDINPENAEKERCVYCGEPAKYWVYIGKTY